MALMNDTLLETSAVFVGPVGSEGGRSPSTLSIGQAVPPGGLAPGQRWSVGRKREVVLRLLRGESAENLSRELGVPSYRLERWREVALSGRRGRTLFPNLQGAGRLRPHLSNHRRRSHRRAEVLRALQCRMAHRKKWLTKLSLIHI